MPRGWGSDGRPAASARAGAEDASPARARAAIAVTVALGYAGTAWAAAIAYLDRWASGSDIPVVAGVFAVPLAAHLLVREHARRDRLRLLALGAAALPLYLTALWVVAESVGARPALDAGALRRVLAESSRVTGFAWCGVSAGASVLAAAAPRPHPGRRLLALACAVLPAAAAYGWSLDRMPRAVALGPALVVVPAAAFLPWIARGLDRAPTARLGVIAAAALFGCFVTGALTASAGHDALVAGELGGYAAEAPVAVLRLLVPAASVLPVLAVLVAIRVLHGPLAASRTATHAALGLAVCTLPLVLQALALRETRAPIEEAREPQAAVAAGAFGGGAAPRRPSG